MTTVPCVAIGGITLDNAPALITAGADFLAVSSAIWDYPDGPQAAVRDFNTLLQSST
jgi:thiamine-phosphate pyrophosphorylase